MKALRTTIQRKMMTSMMATSMTVLLVIGVVFAVFEFVSVRQWLVKALSARAGVLAANSTATLAFEDRQDAALVLSALRSDPSTVAAALYDRNGRLFARFPAGADPTLLPARPDSVGHRFLEKHLDVFRPVIEDGLWLGTLYIRSDLRALDERLRVLALVLLVGGVGSAGVAFWLSTRLQRAITRPVLALVGVASRVTDDADFSVRAPVVSDDELGLLTETFNDMLGQIEARDEALQTNEGRLRAILESALDSIITMDHEGRVVAFNPAAERLFGYERSVALGAELSELIIPPALRERHRQGLSRYLQTGDAVALGRRMELTAMRAGGEEFPVEIAITRIPQAGPPMFTGFIRDITERKRAEAEIQQLNADLERRVVVRTADLESSNKELEAFSYSVSHDLRAPLRALDGFSRAVIDDSTTVLSDTSRRHLERVRNAAGHMAQLIDDMLKLARLARAELHRERVDLSALAAEIAGELRQAQPERAVTFQIADGLTAEGDSQLLRVVLDNLLQNAWKFTSKQPSATIEFRAESENGGRIYRVRDDGAGFDMAHADLLFAPFQRLHRQSEFEGTGIGLATVQRIIRRHRGRLWAEGEVGHGATFRFTLWEGSPHD